MQPRLYEYIGGAIRGQGRVALAINGMSDHVHILTKLGPDKSVSDVLRDMKSNASGWMHDVFPDARDFSWQRGFGAFTVSASQIEKVSRYIAEQEKHHLKFSFQHEFEEFLKANSIEYDKKYLWT